MHNKKIVGIKYTHDSAVALIQGNKLLFSIESEKINNNPRYHSFIYEETPYKIVADLGQGLDDVAIDGWWEESSSCIPTPHAGYSDLDSKGGIYSGRTDGLISSYPHVLGHIIGSYAASPYSLNKIPAAVCVWDGTELPTVYIVNPNHDHEWGKVRLHRRLFSLSGLMYGIIGLYYGPYKNFNENKDQNFPPLNISGKLMSYAGLGKFNDSVYANCFVALALAEEFIVSNNEYMSKDGRGKAEHLFMQYITANIDPFVPDKDVIRTIHEFLKEQLAQRLRQSLPEGIPLVMTGGCALSIKNNSYLLEAGYFANVWVPPFCNDSGSAIGVACAHNAMEYDEWHLDWNVYSGPEIIENSRAAHSFMTPESLGKLLHTSNEPIVVLHGNAELGPRALGHRSILAAPTLDMKDRINTAKKRESFRPVAPVCLEQDAKEFFELVNYDEYMLFDHYFTDEGWEKLPAIRHADRTARVQIASDQFMLRVLKSYKEVSGIGVLCNTSANKSGKGFFPDTLSAIDWAKENGIKYVWCNNKLYTIGETK